MPQKKQPELRKPQHERTPSVSEKKRPNEDKKPKTKNERDKKKIDKLIFARESSEIRRQENDKGLEEVKIVDQKDIIPSAKFHDETEQIESKEASKHDNKVPHP